MHLSLNKTSLNQLSNQYGLMETFQLQDGNRKTHNSCKNQIQLSQMFQVTCLQWDGPNTELLVPMTW